MLLFSSFDDLWNFYFNNGGEVNYPIIIISIAIISLLVSIFWYYNLSRRKLIVKVSNTALLPQNIITGSFYQSVPILTVFITNPSKRNIYIQQPVILLSGNIDGNKEFYVLNITKPRKFPLCINSLEKVDYDFDIESLFVRLFNSHPNVKSFKVLIKDTLNKKYVSSSISIDDLKKYMIAIKKN